MGEHKYLIHATSPEIDRFFDGGRPFQMQHHYFDWLLHLRNNQMATLSGGALRGVPNVIFDVINEYHSVLSGVEIRLTTVESDLPIWPKLLIRSHQVSITAFHVAVGCLLQEAGALMRLSIELFAHARYIEKNPYLEKVWLRKDDPSIKKQYVRNFEKDKTEKLFAGIDELHRYFGFWSELGSHSGSASLHLHRAPSPLEVSAQTDDLDVTNEVLLHLLSTCLCMADLAKLYVKSQPLDGLQNPGRQERLARYQPRLQQLNWTLKDHPLFGSSS